MKEIQRAVVQTVQDLPDVKKDGGWQNSDLYSYGTKRQALLPAWGTRERERALRLLWHHDDNLTFRSGVAGLIKRVISTPYEIKGTETVTKYFQNLLQYADFDTWDAFVSKLLTDFFRQDIGAFIEVIGAGDPRGPLLTPPSGIAVLDSLRCWVTGDPEYPVIYYSDDGALHYMHHTRVIRFYDNPDTDEYKRGYGQCGLSRAVPAVWREILMSRYIQTQLDDQPPPGIVTFTGVTAEQYRMAVEQRDTEREMDAGSEWGRSIKMFGINPANPVTVDFNTFSTPPEAWDYQAYTELTVKQIALALGVDILDLWELTGRNNGTATQSKVMADKSKGRALGRILKSLERIINQLMPETVTFEFKYRDAQEDVQEAQKANEWASFIVSAGELLTVDERRELLANQVEAFRDAVTDIDGKIVRYDDAQQVPEGQTLNEGEVTLDETDVESTNEAVKEITSTRQQFAREFRETVNFLRSGVVTKAGARTGLRGVLTRYGRMALLDGMQSAGGSGNTLDAPANRALREWRAKQTQFVRNFIDVAEELPDTELNRRIELWINMSIDPMYYKGMELQAPRQMYMWTLNPTKENCVTCLKLNGQVHMLSSYARMGLVPKSRNLVCGGWQCGCTLTPTYQPARGRLRGVRFVRGRKHVHNHAEAH